MKDNNLLFLDEEDESKKTDLKSQLSNQKKGMQKLEERIKLQIFNVFCSILKNFELAPWKIYILLIIEFIQFLSFPFHQSIVGEWKDQFVIKYFMMFVQVFTVRFWIDYTNLAWSYYLIVFYVLILIVFLVIIDFFYCSFAINNSRHAFSFTWPIHLLQYACLLLMTILFQPILDLFLSMLSCVSMATALDYQSSIILKMATTSNTSTTNSSTTSTNYTLSLTNSSSSNSSGVLVLEMFPSIECFSSTHIMHAIFSIVIAIILTCLTLMVVFLMFESRKSSTNIISKLNSRMDFFQTLVKFILVVVFAFLEDQSFQTFKVLLLVVISSITFLKAFLMRPYYNQRINDVISVFQGIFAWTSYVLIIATAIDAVHFNMSAIIYLLGIPIVITLVLTFRQKSINILLIPLQKHIKGEDSLSQFNHLLYIIQSKDQRRESAIMVKGYVNFHEMTCTDSTCSLKHYQKNMVKNNQILNRRVENNEENVGLLGNESSNQHKIMHNESNSLLLNHMKQLLERSIRKFPSCSILRIHYAHFLLDQMGNKREAMRELNECMKLKPPLDQQFMIVRYKKLIGDSLIEGGKEGGGGYEYISAMNFESNYRKCKNNIEKSALLHYEFWNHLLEDSPDLGRLSDLGLKIDESIKQVEVYWNEMQYIFPNTPKALKLYASFLIEVLNDKEGGNECLIKAKEATQIKANYDFGGGSEDMSNGAMSGTQQDGSPVVYISGENDRLGLITNLNLATCRVFGYQRKEELLNKNIKVIQPSIYQIFHDEFLRTAVMKNSDQFAANKERSVYGKHVSGYIFPLSLQIKYFQSFLHGKQFVATLKSEKKGIAQSVVYAIIDKKGIIMDVSSSSIQLLDIDKNKMVKKRIRYDANILMPGLMGTDMQKYLSKQGERLNFFFPEIVEAAEKKRDEHSHEDVKSDHSLSADDDQISNQGAMTSQKMNKLGMNNNFYDDESSGKEDKYGGGPQQDSALDQQNEFQVKPTAKIAQFHCNLQQIQFTCIQNGETQAYSARLELIEAVEAVSPSVKESKDDDGQVHLKIGKSNAKGVLATRIIEKYVKMNKFQFSFNPIYKKFVREIEDDENQENMVDQALVHVKKENLKKGEDQPKLTVMSYLNQMKVKMEKQEENNNAAIMGDDFIKEVDEYSEETHSESDRYAKNNQNSKKSSNETESKKSSQNLQMNMFQDGKDWKKRIAQLLNQKFIPGEDTAEKLMEKMVEMQGILKRKADVGQGVKTYRLTDGELVPVEENPGNLIINKSAETSDLVAEESTEDDSKEEKVDEVLKNTLKSRKAFQSSLNDKSIPPPVQRLQIMANVILFIFIALAIIECIVVRSEFSSIGTNFQMVQQSYQIISQLQQSSFNARSLIFYGGSNLTYNMSATLVNQTYTDMKSSLSSLYTLQNNINLQKLSISDVHYSLLNDKIVPMYFQQQGNSQNITALNFSLTEALLQTSSSLFSISNLLPSKFLDNEDDVFYFMYNNFNDMLSAMIESSNDYVLELLDRTQTSNNETNVIIFYCSIGCVIIGVIALIPVVQIVNKTKRQFLDIFLEIDNNNLRKLSAKCEKFMNMLNDEGNEELDSNDDELEELARLDQAQEDEYQTSRRGKRKRAKNSMKNKRWFLVRFAIGMLIIEVYYFTTYFLGTRFITRCNTTTIEMNLTSQIEPFYWLAVNIQREMMSDPNKYILHEKASDMAVSSIQFIQDYNSDMQQEHLYNLVEVQSSYVSTFQQIMLQDICDSSDIQLQNQTGQDCSTFISGSATQGLHTVIVRYQENLRTTLQNYLNSSKNASAIRTIINSAEMTQIYLMQRYLIGPEMEVLIQALQDSVQSEVTTSLESRLAGFSVFIGSLLFLFVVVWLPFINGLSNEVHQTKKTLYLVPLEILLTMKTVSNLFSKKSRKLQS